MSKIPVSLLLVISILLFVGIVYIVIDKPVFVMYNCTIAEITKNVPDDIKQKCREKLNDSR